MGGIVARTEERCYQEMESRSKGTRWSIFLGQRRAVRQNIAAGFSPDTKDTPRIVSKFLSPERFQYDQNKQSDWSDFIG